MSSAVEVSCKDFVAAPIELFPDRLSPRFILWIGHWLNAALFVAIVIELTCGGIGISQSSLVRRVVILTVQFDCSGWLDFDKAHATSPMFRTVSTTVK